MTQEAIYAKLQEILKTVKPKMDPARISMDAALTWCLSDFNYEGETVMMAPAAGFYTTPGIGRNEVRLAYVLKKEDLTRALFVLRKALEAYPGRV